MPVFQYEALDAQGIEIKDEIEALSQNEAVSKIRNMGYFPTKVAAKSEKKRVARTAVASRAKRGVGGKVKIKFITQFARQLSTLQDAGLPILRSLRILEEQQKNRRFKRIIGAVADDIEGGSTLSEAMVKYQGAFDRLFVGMVAAGEVGGVLDLILSRIADFMEKAQKLKSRVKGAMVYPVIVILISFVILLGLMTFVVPQFDTVLKEMLDGAELPMITQKVLAVSNWIAKQYGWLVLIMSPMIFVTTINVVKKFRNGRLVVDMIKSRLPVVGMLSSKIAITRWTRTLGTLIGAGVPILDAINVTAETSGNELFARMLQKVKNSIRQGDTFAAPIKQPGIVDLLVVNMVSVGEETGDMDKMLLKIANDYDEQVDVLVNGMMSLLEPIMIVVLGVIVCLIVMAIFLPMIRIISTMAGT